MFFTMVVIAVFFTTPLLAQRRYAIYEGKSQYQTVVVWDSPDGQYRQLIFDPKWDGTDAIQSALDKKDPNKILLDYAQYMIASVPLVDNPKRILVVGLGGACIQRYLYKLLPDTIIETAELDPMVLDVAKKYFHYTEDNRQKVHIGDGRAFIEKTKEKYDIIMLDAFSATSIPYMLATQEFLNSVKEHLTEGGIVCANLWAHQADYNDMLKTYDSVFTELHILPCPLPWTNHILVAMPERQRLTVDTWIEKAMAFEKVHPTGLNLTEFINQRIPAMILLTAKVLLDKDAPKD